ncbi:MAG: biotin/lipoyl-binding protein [Campylobacterales bacterium]
MGKKLVHVMDTTFRDGFQSVYGGRVLTKDFLPAVEASVAAGIRHFEMGGGARFQSLYFYCNEDAFAMMDAFRATVGPDITLQTLARGVSYVGLDTGSRAILDLQAKLFKKHGVTTIRNFDALNDVNNLDYSGRTIVAHGLKHEIAVTMMELPPGCSGAHEADFYEKSLREILDRGIPFDSVCFKDASGTARPQKVHETIKMARRLLGDDVHIRFHTHETAGISTTCYMAALEAGADGIDLAMDPVSGGTSQPDILVMMHVLKGTRFDLGLDPFKVLEAQKVLRECLKDYFIPPEAKEVMPIIQFSPMPGGALTANTQMMRDNKCLDKFPQVIEAMNEVVKVGGFGTSVTPVSQFYFQQAFNNVLIGPWKKIADGYGKMVLGYFGKTPVAPEAWVVELAREQLGLEPTTEHPLDVADRDYYKSIDYAKLVLAEHNLPDSDENIFIILSCGDKGLTFLKGEARLNIRKIEHEDLKKTPQKHHEEDHGPLFDTYQLTHGDQSLGVLMVNDQLTDELKARWEELGISWKLEAKAKKKDVGSAIAVADDGKVHVHSPLPGTVVKVLVNAGDSVEDGQVIVILEAMKMVMEVQSPVNGVVSSLKVNAGEAVETGQVLVSIDDS